MRISSILSIGLAWGFVLLAAQAAETPKEKSAQEHAWRPIPLIKEGNVDPNWVHIGYGKFVVDEGALRTEPAAEGLGLLVYKKEKLGDCQIKLVFKPKEARSNSGFYVRMDDGILKQVNNPGAKFSRDEQGNISEDSMKKAQESAEKEEGPWYAVHHGYEVQIAGGGDPTHGTGSIYSLASTGAKKREGGEWRTMIVTLRGSQITVDLDGERVTSFDSAMKNHPPRKVWHEPKREHKRPNHGYIGIQTHDPGDIVWFKEISVRPIPAEAAAGKKSRLREKAGVTAE